MKSEYDFSQAVRGKFYREGAKFISPVHVTTDVAARLSELAAEKKMSASDLANEILRRAIAEMDAASKIG
jgi:tryptophanyl-tRNA synthetase